MHEKSPTIDRLAVHLETSQHITPTQGEASELLQHTRQTHATLTAWFKLKKGTHTGGPDGPACSLAQGLTSENPPYHSTWQNQTHGGCWLPRKAAFAADRAIGRTPRRTTGIMWPNLSLPDPPPCAEHQVVGRLLGSGWASCRRLATIMRSQEPG